MPFTPKQIEFLARTIVNRLEDRGLVEFGDAEAGIDVVTRTILENFRAGESIALEARERLARVNADREPTEDELLEEMRRIAEGRSFVI